MIRYQGIGCLNTTDHLGHINEAPNSNLDQARGPLGSARAAGPHEKAGLVFL